MAETWCCSKRRFKTTWINDLRGTQNMQISDGDVQGLYLRYSRFTHKISFYLGCTPKSTGKRTNVFLGKLGDYKSIDELKEKARQLRHHLVDGEDPKIVEKEIIKAKVVQECERLPFEKLFDTYMEKYTKLYKKPSTAHSNWGQYRLYLKPMFGDKYIQEIEEQHVVDAYTVWVKNTSFSTANKALSLLSSFWDWCETYKYVPRKSNPCQFVKRGTNPKFKPQILDNQGYKEFLAALERGPKESNIYPSCYDALKVLALTGCRYSEIKELWVADVSLEEKTIHLHESKTGPRDVRLCDAVIPILEKAVKEAKQAGSKYVFHSPNDITKPVSGIRLAFQWILKNTKLPHMRIHDLRHSYISMGANSGQNMVAMRDVAGHTRLSTTELYTHLAESNAFVAVNNVADSICG